MSSSSSPPSFNSIKIDLLRKQIMTLKLQIERHILYVEAMEREYISRFEKLNKFMVHYEETLKGINKNSEILKGILEVIKYNILKTNLEIPYSEGTDTTTLSACD